MAFRKWFLKFLGLSNKDVNPASPTLTYDGHVITPEPNETVLEALLRNGYAIPNSCRAGACQSCMMVADSSTRANLPEASQAPLTAAEKQQGLFLACSARLQSPLVASMPQAQLHPETEAKIVNIDYVNDRVVRLQLSADFSYHAGQFVNLVFPSASNTSERRSYSLASVPGIDTHCELHVKLLNGGECSDWLQNRAEVGQAITLEGPHGHCYYTDDCEKFPHLVLAGIGTGLAPLWGIVRDALKHKYAGSIDLLIAARHVKDLYLVDELTNLAEQTPELRLRILVQEQAIEKHPKVEQADIYQQAQSLDIDYSRAAVFLCGAESFVQKMKKTLFVKGTPMRAIVADAFVKS